MKIPGLISADITPLLDELLSSVQKDSNLSPEDFEKVMQEKGQKIFEVMETETASFLSSLYTVAHFREQHSIAEKNSR